MWWIPSSRVNFFVVQCVDPSLGFNLVIARIRASIFAVSNRRGER